MDVGATGTTSRAWRSACLCVRCVPRATVNVGMTATRPVRRGAWLNVLATM